MPAVTLSTYALVNVEELNDFIGKGSNDDADKRKIRIINQASPGIETFLDRHLVTRGSLAEFHTIPDGCETDEIRLCEWPATAVASVYEDADAGSVQVADRYPASTLLTVNVDYELIASTREPATQSILRRIGAAWATGRRAIKVTCTAGYATTAAVPQPIKEVCLELCALKWRDASKQEYGVTSFTDQMGAVTRTLPALLTESMQARLAPFRRYEFEHTWEKAA